MGLYVAIVGGVVLYLGGMGCHGGGPGTLVTHSCCSHGGRVGLSWDWRGAGVGLAWRCHRVVMGLPWVVMRLRRATVGALHGAAIGFLLGYCGVCMSTRYELYGELGMPI